MSRNYKFHNKSGLYFVSFATVKWINVFTEKIYFEVILDSINYCRKFKEMELYCYCIMPNHIHFIFRSSQDKPMELLRDFKKFTAKALLATIENSPEELRKNKLLYLFKEAGKTKRNITTYQFWQHNNQPIELWSEHVIRQKVNYIHNNPVKAGLVANPIDWKYSSARNFEDDHSVLKIDDMGFLN